MSETWINGRPATAAEAEAVEHARKCELEQAKDLLAGILGARVVLPETASGRPVTDISLGGLP